MGIRGKFITLLGTLSVIGMAIIGFAVYTLSTKRALNEAKDRAEIILNYELATKRFTAKYQRPRAMKIAPKGSFDPYLMSGFATARQVYDLFKETMPQYIFKQATLSPLQASNKADNNEVTFIRKFADNKKLKELSGIVEHSGEEHLYVAKPIVVSDQKCLKCHGDPADAPKEQVQIYGKTNGYNWKLGETVAAFVVYVPIGKTMTTARRAAITLFSVGLVSIAITLLILWFFLDKGVVAPIIFLSKKTEEISLGQNLNEPVDTERKDEIGQLMKGVERLRKSTIVFIENSKDDDGF